MAPALNRQIRVVALATNPVNGASTRFRVVQWQSHLSRAGFSLHLEPFFSNAASSVMYERGRLLAKLWHLAACSARRIKVLLTLSATADVVFIHRELFPLGWLLFLGWLRRFDGVVVYDYDDAMFLPQRRGRGILQWLERLDTPRRLMAISDVVFAGNPFLADYAERHGSDVVLLPTCIDTNRFRPAAAKEFRTRPVIGWIGSHTTSRYLETLLPTLEKVARRVPFELYAIGCAQQLKSKGFSIVQREWCLEREVADFQHCDVGVYPLSDDEWSRGKSGFKAIQFMACGVPVIASPVGVTQQIICDGQNGFLVHTEDDWVERLTGLLSEAALRERLGAAGRRTVEARYSLVANAPVLLGALTSAMARAERGARAPNAV